MKKLYLRSKGFSQLTSKSGIYFDSIDAIAIAYDEQLQTQRI